MEQIGLITQEDEIVPDYSDNVHFMVWSNLQFKSKVAQKQVLERVVNTQQDDMTQEVNADVIKSTYRSLYSSADSESQLLNETEILEKVEKRFGKALPLDSVNVILLKEMTE